MTSCLRLRLSLPVAKKTSWKEDIGRQAHPAMVKEGWEAHTSRGDQQNQHEQHDQYNQDKTMDSSRLSRTVRPDELSRRERYQLLTSLVIPRPIGWISTVSAAGVPNLAPYSFFNALAASPPMVGVSIGVRAGEPKDTLVNIRETSAFAVNICSEELLEAMNASSAELGSSVDEFEVAGLTAEAGLATIAPVVGEAPAVLECELFREVELGEASNVLVIGEVKVVRISEDLVFEPDTRAVDPRSLKAVGRLGADQYSFLREIVKLPRPR